VVDEDEQEVKTPNAKTEPITFFIILRLDINVQ
jgi:hypothetical protein